MLRSGKPLLALLAAAALLVSGCATPPASTATPPPPTAHSPTPTAITTGDPARGKAVFEGATGVTPACTSCHSAGRDRQPLVGPPLFGVADIVDVIIEEKVIPDFPYASPESYIRDSVENPGVFLVPGFPDIMPKNFKAQMSEEEMADLVAYIASLRGLTKEEALKELGPPPG